MGDLADSIRDYASRNIATGMCRRWADEVEALEARVAKADRWLAERIEAADRAAFVEEENGQLRTQLEARTLTARTDLRLIATADLEAELNARNADFRVAAGQGDE